MKYQSQNISELCAFVAAIRPGFKSMYSIFENRQPFSYNIPAFDNLIQTPEMPNSFLLYQEQAMTALNFADIPMSECYEVIVNIAKKRPEKVKKYKEEFLEGFKNKLIEVEKLKEDEAKEISDKVWQIIDDSCRYSFNASHSYCMAMDSLYGAYLKSHYPLQFYEVFLNILNDKSDKDRMTDVKKEAEIAFKIKFEPLRFRQDNRNFTADIETNTIWSTLKSIKGFGDNIAKQLYELKDKKYETFIDLLVDFEERGILSTKIEALIKLNYFEEYGQNGGLLNLYSEFTKGKSRYLKTHSNKTKEKRIVELKEIMVQTINDSIPLIEQIKIETELLGLPMSVYDLPKHVVALDVNTQNSPKIKIYGLKTGKVSIVKIRKIIYNQNRIKEGNIFIIDKYVQKPKAILIGFDKNNKPQFEQSITEKDIWVEAYTLKKIS